MFPPGLNVLGPNLNVGVGPEPRALRRVMANEFLVRATAFVPTSGTAYFVYCGRTEVAAVWKYTRAYSSIAGAGAQTAEVGIFSTPLAPIYGTNQTLTKIEATGTVDDLTVTTDDRGNTTAFTTVVPAGTHLWSGWRTAMAATQPTLFSMLRDMGQGNVLTTAAAGALTASSTFTGVNVGNSLVALCPDAWISMD